MYNLWLGENYTKNAELNYNRVTHSKLVTDAIKNEIRDRIKKEQCTPGYVLVEYEDTTILLSKYMTHKDLEQAECPEYTKLVKSIRFPAYRIREDEMESYLSWFSGFVTGIASSWHL